MSDLLEGLETGVFYYGGILFVLLYFLRLWLRGPTTGSDNPKRLDGKVVVITGANTGIGKITATDLARRGARVIICCRDMKRASAGLADIKAESGSDNVEIVQLDLASLKSVRKAALELSRKEEKIDYLINNAGVMMCPQWKTEDGFDMQMGTNHFGHFLFTELLTPLVKKAATEDFTPRIVILSSLAHGGAKEGISFDDINFEESFQTMQVYSQSKLANILHAKELARRLEGTGVSVYALHPGVIATELGRHLKGGKILGWILTPVLALASFLIKTPFHGAQTTLYCTLEDSIEKDSGKYYSDCGVAKTSTKHAEDMEAAKKLWDLSEKVVNRHSL